jgi:hypothetical protein
MDPFQMALLMMQAGQNPEQMAALLDKSGIPPPTSPQAGAAGVPTNVAGTTLDEGGLGAILRGSPGTPQAEAASAPATAAVPAAASAEPATAAGAGKVAQPPIFKAPAPITPIMHGGVTGGTPPPKVNASFTGVTPAMALMQALISGGQQNPLRVPNLGAMLRGRG